MGKKKVEVLNSNVNSEVFQAMFRNDKEVESASFGNLSISDNDLKWLDNTKLKKFHAKEGADGPYLSCEALSEKIVSLGLKEILIDCRGKTANEILRLIIRGQNSLTRVILKNCGANYLDWIKHSVKNNRIDSIEITDKEPVESSWSCAIL